MQSSGSDERHRPVHDHFAASGARIAHPVPPKDRELVTKQYQTYLWRDLQGRNMSRVFAACILDELCRESDMKTSEMLRQLRKQLDRPLSRQTFTAWRRADQSIPTEVLLVVAWITRRKVSDAAIAVAMNVLSDPKADPAFREMTRRYFSQGRVTFPST
jgi:hypothetical protein